MQIRIYNADGGEIVFDRDYRFTFEFTKNTSVTPNPCTVAVKGIANRDTVHKIADPYEGEERSKGLRFFDQQSGAFVFSYTAPALAATDKNLPSVEGKRVAYKPIGWAKCEIYDEKTDQIIYVGDVIDVEDTPEEMVFQLGTAHYFMKMPYAQRTLEDSFVEKGFRVMRQHTLTADSRAPGMAAVDQYFNPYVYYTYAEAVVDEILNIDRGYFNELSKSTPDTLDRENKVYLDALQELITKGDLNVTTVRTGGDASTAYYMLSGTVEEVLRKLADTGLFSLFCVDDRFFMQNYFFTHNPPGLVQPGVGFAGADTAVSANTPANRLPKYRPVADFFVDRDKRAVFTTGPGMMLMPSHGLFVYDESIRKAWEVYIDTVECSGDQESYMTTYSGRTNKFLWRAQ